MSNAKHPELNTSLLHELLNAVYQRPLAAQQYQLKEILRRNNQCQRCNASGFWFNGDVYPKFLMSSRIPLLHISLRPQMREYLSFAHKLDGEMQLLRGYLANMLTTHFFKEDQQACLPESLAPIIGAFSGYPRMAPRSEEEQAALTVFLQKNEKYLTMLRTRLTLNLLGVSS